MGARNTKVVHVINSMAAGGAERLVSDLLPRLKGLGIDCSLFVLDSRGDVFSRELIDAGIEVSFARRDGASPYSPLRAADIGAHLAAMRPEVIHAHLGPSLHWAALVRGFAKNASLVATEHAVETRRTRNPLISRLDTAVYR